jgi:hypothetical protein
MRKKIAISQSCFMPWRGFFDIIRQVDEFIINDGWQYNWSSWRNRNVIKTQHGPKWISIPVRRISHAQTIAQTQVVSQAWRKRHWRSISQSYAKAPLYQRHRAFFEELYFTATAADTFLSDINYKFLAGICDLLAIHTPITRITQYEKHGDKNDAVISCCRAFGATHYLTLPASKAYIDPEAFRREGITLEWMKYDYPEYLQLFPPFVAKVSIIDTIFNTENIF